MNQAVMPATTTCGGTDDDAEAFTSADNSTGDWFTLCPLARTGQQPQGSRIVNWTSRPRRDRSELDTAELGRQTRRETRQVSRTLVPTADGSGLGRSSKTAKIRAAGEKLLKRTRTGDATVLDQDDTIAMAY